MGKQNRFRKILIRSRLAQSIAQITLEESDTPLRCECCQKRVPANQARDHVRQCWGIDLAETEPLPTPEDYHRLVAEQRIR